MARDLSAFDVGADGAVWTPVRGNACSRVNEGSEVLQQIELDRRTLFMVAAKWRPENPTGERRTGQVPTIEAPAPGVGWP